MNQHQFQIIVTFVRRIGSYASNAVYSPTVMIHLPAGLNFPKLNWEYNRGLRLLSLEDADHNGSTTAGIDRRREGSSIRPG